MASQQSLIKSPQFDPIHSTTSCCLSEVKVVVGCVRRGAGRMESCRSSRPHSFRDSRCFSSSCHPLSNCRRASVYHQVEVTSECDVEDCSRVCVCAVLPVDAGQGACIADTAQC